MMSVRLRKMSMTTAAALAAGLLGAVAGTASAGDAPRTAQVQQAPPAATSDGPRIDRTRPGRRQPAFGLRRLTPLPTQAQSAPNRPL